MTITTDIRHVIELTDEEAVLLERAGILVGGPYNRQLTMTCDSDVEAIELRDFLRKIVFRKRQ